MRTNLLEYLFGKTVIREEAELGEQIVRLFEEADEAEGIELVANKKPLADALKTMGIDEPVELGAQWAEIHCDDDAEYHEYIRALSDPDNMHKLAEMGWVMARCGDIAMSNEQPDYKIGFIEIETAESGEADKPDEKVKSIIKKGQEFATTPVEQDDDLNPVEREQGKPDAKLSGKTTGVGKPKDGADPEGKPKGSTKDESLLRVNEWDRRTAERVNKKAAANADKPGTYYGHKANCSCSLCAKRKAKAKSESMVDKLLAEPVQEMTGTGSCGTFSGGGVPPVMAQTGLRSKKRRMKPIGKASDAMRP